MQQSGSKIQKALVAGGGGARGVEQRDVGEHVAGIVDVCWAHRVAAAIQGFVIVDVCWARPIIGLPCTRCYLRTVGGIGLQLTSIFRFAPLSTTLALKQHVGVGSAPAHNALLPVHAHMHKCSVGFRAQLSWLPVLPAFTHARLDHHAVVSSYTGHLHKRAQCFRRVRSYNIAQSLGGCEAQ